MIHPLASRRQFLSGTAIAGAASLLPGTAGWAAIHPPRVVSVVTRSIEVKRKAATVYGLVADDGKRGLTFTAGDSFYVRLDNKLSESTMVHWHGLTPPARQDGVPGLSYDPIAAGKSETYDFRLTEPGTHWMHSHFSLTQIQRLMASPLIIRSPEDNRADEQEVVIMLNDFTFEDPEAVLAKLKKSAAAEAAPAAAGMAGMPGMAGMADGMANIANMQHNMPGMAPSRNAAAAAPKGTAQSGAGGMPAGMQMDVNDIDFDAYLANDRTLEDPEVVQVAAGGRVRLRIIVGTASTNFTLDMGQLEGELIAVDGVACVPIKRKQFPMAMAQRLDIRLRLPAGGGAFPILAQREDDTIRTGIVLATPRAQVQKVADRAAKKAPIVGLELEKLLRAAEPLKAHPADRTIPVVLGGDMAKYVWTMNGAVFGGDKPLQVSLGERVEIAMRNDTGMSHPMHLHGTSFQVVEIDGRRFPGARRDTVMVPPNTRVTIAFDAVNAGQWAFHCHNSYHQEAGMMTSVQYV